MKSGKRNLVEKLSGAEGLSFLKNFPLSSLTAIGTGGRARYYASVERVSALQKLLKELDGPFFILGSGTNLLLSDRDFPGVMIHLGRSFRRLRQSEGEITCGAAVPLARLVERAIAASFAGFEELSGVPGSVGGAAAMNAGTHIKELGDLVESLCMVDTSGRRRFFSKGQLRPSYRSSLAPVPGVITTLTFLRQPGGDPERQRGRALELQNGRKLKHPWQEKTFGSTFKNPPGMIAAKLIDQAELKGFRIGGAQVSPKHANFIENNRGAGALDILELIKHVRRVVRTRFGITLEPEVRLVGFTREELGELAPYAVSPPGKV